MPAVGVRLVPMGLLTKPALDEVLSLGCACGGTKLEFDTYVDGRFTLLGGEQYGPVVWAYKGETFVDGVFRISCASCKKRLFESEVCPRCNAQAGLATALAAEGRLAVPRACPRCKAQTLSYTAMLPARVVYEGQRPQKARGTVEMGEEGFHGLRVDCKACGVLATVAPGCPLCAAPGPLRDRPD